MRAGKRFFLRLQLFENSAVIELRFYLPHYYCLYPCALLSFIIFKNCEVLAIFLRLLNILIILCFWSNGFFPYKGFLTAIDVSLQIKLEKSSRTSRGWGTVRVSFICIKSIICKLGLELALFRGGPKKQIRWIILCRCLFSLTMQNAEIGDLAFWHIVSWHESHLQWLLILCQKVKLSRHWELLSWRKDGRKTSRALHALLAVGLSFFLFLCYFYPFGTLTGSSSIKLHECDSSSETRILPKWILLGRRRNNSMS